MRIITPFIFAFAVIIDLLKTDLGFSDKSYEEILLKYIEVCCPRVRYAGGRKHLLWIHLLIVNFQQKI